MNKLIILLLAAPFVFGQNGTPVGIWNSGTQAAVTAGNALKVDASATTQPVSGTVAATQSGTWTMQPGNTPNTTPWIFTIQQGGNSATVSAGGALKVDGSAVTQPVSGTVTANAGTGTFAVSATSLPLPTGASTAAKQPALGTAGSSSTDVLTIQGIASMTKILVTPDSVALPANQSVNVNQIGGTNVSTGNGTQGSGTQRVVIASDQTAYAVNAAATLNAETTKVIGTVRILGNAGATLDGAPGSAVPANAQLVGGTDGTNTRVHYMDPCEFNIWVYYPINVSSNTQIIAGSASKNVYVCQLFIAPVAAAANVNIVESATSGNACATSPTGMMGGATAALGGQLTANGGWVMPFGTRAWMKTATAADAMCIFTSAQVTGVLAYVQF